jgi:hypothetical protein
MRFQRAALHHPAGYRRLTAIAPTCAGVVQSKEFTMLLPVFSGQNYSYSYEPETGNYLLHDNDYRSHIYLQGKDAYIFRKKIELIDELPDPEYKTGLLTENAISIYL